MPLKILVIEDDRSLTKAYASRLAAEGLDVLTAGDGQEGLALILTERPDVILLDLLMPIMDGYAVLAAKAQAEDAIKGIPVIVLSNFGEQSEIDRATSLGAHGYLVKSNVSLTEVIDKVKDVAGK
jgi:CheY-like chemotaxis protein